MTSTTNDVTATKMEMMMDAGVAKDAPFPSWTTEWGPQEINYAEKVTVIKREPPDMYYPSSPTEECSQKMRVNSNLFVNGAKRAELARGLKTIKEERADSQMMCQYDSRPTTRNVEEPASSCTVNVKTEEVNPREAVKMEMDWEQRCTADYINMDVPLTHCSLKNNSARVPLTHCSLKANSAHVPITYPTLKTNSAQIPLTHHTLKTNSAYFPITHRTLVQEPVNVSGFYGNAHTTSTRPDLDPRLTFGKTVPNFVRYPHGAVTRGHGQGVFSNKEQYGQVGPSLASIQKRNGEERCNLLCCSNRDAFYITKGKNRSQRYVDFLSHGPSGRASLQTSGTLPAENQLRNVPVNRFMKERSETLGGPYYFGSPDVFRYVDNDEATSGRMADLCDRNVSAGLDTFRNSAFPVQNRCSQWPVVCVKMEQTEERSDPYAFNATNVSNPYSFNAANASNPYSFNAANASNPYSFNAANASNPYSFNVASTGNPYSFQIANQTYCSENSYAKMGRGDHTGNHFEIGENGAQYGDNSRPFSAFLAGSDGKYYYMDRTEHEQRSKSSKLPNFDTNQNYGMQQHGESNYRPWSTNMTSKGRTFTVEQNEERDNHYSSNNFDKTCSTDRIAMVLKDISVRDPFQNSVIREKERDEYNSASLPMSGRGACNGVWTEIEHTSTKLPRLGMNQNERIQHGENGVGQQRTHATSEVRRTPKLPSRVKKAAKTNPKGPHTCTECKKTFVRFPNFQAHLQKREKNNGKCNPRNVCKDNRMQQDGESSVGQLSTNATPEENTTHKVSPQVTEQRETIPNGPHTCTECKKTFLRFQNLESHTRKREKKGKCPPQVFCKECGKSFTSAESLRVHSLLHSGERPFVCDQCGDDFVTKSTLTVHMRRHTGEKPFKCTQCPRAFTTSSALKDHGKTHSSLRPYVCDDCGATFKHRKAFKHHTNRHSKSHTTDTNHERFLCFICGITYPTLCQLIGHERVVHFRDRAFSCKLCGNAYGHSCQLKAHMRRHNGYKPLSCTECEASFSCRVQLRAHMSKHTGIKPCACKDCGKRFTTPGHLQVHRRLHTGYLPHVCPECGKRFATSSHKKVHINKSCPRTSNKRSGPRTSIKKSGPQTSIKKSGPQTSIKKSGPRFIDEKSDPRTSKEKSDQGTSNEKPGPRKSNKKSDPGSSIRKSGLRTSITKSGPRFIDEKSDPRTSKEKSDQGTSNEKSGPRKSNKKSDPRTSKKKSGPRTSITKSDLRTSDKKSCPHTSNKTSGPRTSNIKSPSRSFNKKSYLHSSKNK